jgi:hypothetical protein
MEEEDLVKKEQALFEKRQLEFEKELQARRQNEEKEKSGWDIIESAFFTPETNRTYRIRISSISEPKPFTYPDGQTKPRVVVQLFEINGVLVDKKFSTASFQLMRLLKPYASLPEEDLKRREFILKKELIQGRTKYTFEEITK